MTKTIRLDGGKELKLAANAATPFRYKQLFNEDLLKLFYKSTKSEDDGMVLGDVCAKLAYIMNQQAEQVDMNTISMDAFFSWLENYDAMELISVGKQIMDTYLASSNPSVEAKKK